MTAPPNTSPVDGNAVMLSPFRFGTVGLRNRVAVASMTRVSATVNGIATGRRAEHYRAFADGGFGLVITEGAYGGPAAARVQMLAETVCPVRAAIGPTFLVGIRVSRREVNDFTHSWAGRDDDARVIFSTLAASGSDYTRTTEHEAWCPAFVGGGSTLAPMAKSQGGLPVIADGAPDNPARAAAVLKSGAADRVALARGALANTDWPERVRECRAALKFDREARRSWPILSTPTRAARLQPLRER